MSDERSRSQTPSRSAEPVVTESGDRDAEIKQDLNSRETVILYPTEPIKEEIQVTSC
ncbi:MAG: hypothetical protein HY785_28975 [Oscillatoriophycideae cyanobacterium NC_groundwater_1537_Pr4_S-0.65um_50_18]|nr:hypothetical protein [Oscillatoriophycideae cyanobacterium NC_groundwater_1537_Pr4_S-0.65um_50_18]